MIDAAATIVTNAAISSSTSVLPERKVLKNSRMTLAGIDGGGAVVDDLEVVHELLGLESRSPRLHEDRGECPFLRRQVGDDVALLVEVIGVGVFACVCFLRRGLGAPRRPSSVRPRPVGACAGARWR